MAKNSESREPFPNTPRHKAESQRKEALALKQPIIDALLSLRQKFSEQGDPDHKITLPELALVLHKSESDTRNSLRRAFDTYSVDEALRGVGLSLEKTPEKAPKFDKGAAITAFKQLIKDNYGRRPTREQIAKLVKNGT